MPQASAWIAQLLANLDGQVEPETLVRALEGCGRTCLSRSMVIKAKACYREASDRDAFLTKLAEVWSHLERVGDEVHVVYPRCYCHLVKEYAGELPPAFCNCSRGWVKELFESVLERPVEVELLKSLKRGDDECRFRVNI